MNFNQFLLYRALSAKAHIENQAFNSEFTDRQIDLMANQNPDIIKTVCAPISLDLFDRMNATLGILDVSKRQFIELAIIAALDQAEAVISEVDVYEGFTGTDPFGHTDVEDFK